MRRRGLRWFGACRMTEAHRALPPFPHIIATSCRQPFHHLHALPPWCGHLVGSLVRSMDASDVSSCELRAVSPRTPREVQQLRVPIGFYTPGRGADAATRPTKRS